MKNTGIKTLIAILVIAGMLFASIGVAMAEPNFVLSGRDKVGTFGKDGKSARVGFINTTCMEGPTSNAFNTCVSAVDPTGLNVILFPDSSGTVAISGASPVGDTLTDTKILVGNSAGTAVEQSHTLAGDVTGTMANSGALTATLAANSVSVSQAFLNSVTLLVAAGTSTNSVTVDSGHKLMGFYISTIGGINGANLLNSPAYDGASSWTIAMKNAVSADSVWTFVFLSDN